MKKSLLALAVLGAFATAASAQSSVTVYGKVDVGAVYELGSVAGVNPTGAKRLALTSGVSGGSRLGFRGVEDLGGGLKANFVAETGFCADSAAGGGFCTGGGVFMGRQAFVGLSGGFGSVTMGRQYNPVFIVVTTVDPFGTGLAGNAGNVNNAGASLVDVAGVRWNNSIAYSTPNMSGFSATIMGAAGEQLGNWKTNRTFGASATYSAGPVFAGGSFARIEDGTPAADRKILNAGVTYDFGMAKAHALYTRVDHGANDSDALLGGVSARFGASTVMASYIRFNDKATANRDSNQIAVGYMYSLSKRTSLYGSAARITNKNGATFRVGNATEPGTGRAAINAGVVHNF